MEQPTIFGEQFDKAFLVRRRSLLSVGLKIYIWLGMVFACISCMTVLTTIYLNNERFRSLGINYFQMGGVLVVAMVFGGVIFSMTALLWLEVKWAIWYNWVIGGLWVMLLTFIYFTDVIMPIYRVGTLLTIPYWIMLFRIQRRWEQVAIAKKDLRL